MPRKYWLDLWTGKTWNEFLNFGADVSGFRERKRKIAQSIHPGDFLICYVTGISRFIGILEVLSECYVDRKPIYQDDIFPVRFKVKVLYQLQPETAVPIRDLREKLSLFKGLRNPKAWSGFFRGSPTEFTCSDGEVLIEAIKKAVEHPVVRNFDEKKYFSRLRSHALKSQKVVIRQTLIEEELAIKSQDVTHEEIQYLLLKLGSDMGLDVWVARSDKNKEFKGNSFQEIAGLRKELPRQFDSPTTKVIEMIDVIWLKKDAFIAAFEVEHTSAIYSGLLRMSDLVSMQPNIRLKLYLVAPDVRRDKVRAEINRPTFSNLIPPLPKICKFIPYSELKSRIEKIGDVVRHMKPDFIDDIAETCEVD